MPTPDSTGKTGAGFNILLENTMRLAVIALLLLWCFLILKPFVTVVMWGAIIAVTLYPAFLKLKRLLGGRGKLAAVLFTVITLAVVSVPAIMITDSLLRTGAHLAGTLREEGGIRLPPPPEKVLSWPLIGEQAHAFWTLATQNLQQALEMARPQVRRVLAFVGSRLAGAVVTVLLSLVAIVIAGFFLGAADRCGSTTRAIGKRIGGEPGVQAVGIAGATIRSVAQGVVGVALVQGTLAGIGLFLMGVPAAGLWTLLVMILAVMQVPPLLVLGPIVIWAFSVAESTVAPIIFAVWCLLVSVSDGVLKPLFLGRGVAIPMPVILLGAIGGMLLSGIIGLFVGAVVLSIGYSLFQAWMQSASAEP